MTPVCKGSPSLLCERRAPRLVRNRRWPCTCFEGALAIIARAPSPPRRQLCTTAGALAQTPSLRAIEQRWCGGLQRRVPYPGRLALCGFGHLGATALGCALSLRTQRREGPWESYNGTLIAVHGAPVMNMVVAWDSLLVAQLNDTATLRRTPGGDIIMPAVVRGRLSTSLGPSGPSSALGHQEGKPVPSLEPPQGQRAPPTASPVVTPTVAKQEPGVPLGHELACVRVCVCWLSLPPPSKLITGSLIVSFTFKCGPPPLQARPSASTSSCW